MEQYGFWKKCLTVMHILIFKRSENKAIIHQKSCLTAVEVERSLDILL